MEPIKGGGLVKLPDEAKKVVDIIKSSEQYKKIVIITFNQKQADLIEQREITKEEGKLVALTVCADYMETSAKENINIKESFCFFIGIFHLP